MHARTTILDFSNVRNKLRTQLGHPISQQRVKLLSSNIHIDTDI